MYNPYGSDSGPSGSLGYAPSNNFDQVNQQNSSQPSFSANNQSNPYAPTSSYNSPAKPVANSGMPTSAGNGTALDAAANGWSGINPQLQQVYQQNGVYNPGAAGSGFKDAAYWNDKPSQWGRLALDLQGKGPDQPGPGDTGNMSGQNQNQNPLTALAGLFSGNGIGKGALNGPIRTMQQQPQSSYFSNPNNPYNPMMANNQDIQSFLQPQQNQVMA